MLVICVGIFALIHSIFKDIEVLPIAVAFLLAGITLLAVSIQIANKKIKLIQTGYLTKGTYKEWKNSFIIFNNSSLVFLIYTYFNHRKLKEASVLSSNINALKEVTIIYNDDESLILEYLPGRPEVNEITKVIEKKKRK
ncbi:hypothetical protein [Paenibacillus sp. BC26]|uniref:hypothetical protein n=1 Tax=Paenibacillus sp. BC26 TaxID=1881032 RepID=UPI00116054D7|nr:hypothetical protein [Paenibacillus sp. BC26]